MRGRWRTISRRGAAGRVITVYAKRFDSGILFYDCRSAPEARALALALKKCPDVSAVWIEPEERGKVGE